MQKVNSKLVFLLLLSLALASQLFAPAGSTKCCSKDCPESRIIGTLQTPNAFKNLILNALKYSIPLEKWSARLKDFPPEYTQSLLGRLSDMKQRIGEKVSTCSRDVTNSPEGLKSFTDADDLTVNIIFDALRHMINKNHLQESSNYIGTWAHFIEGMRLYYNSLIPNDITSSKFVFTQTDKAQAIRLVAGMGLQHICYHRFGALEQTFVKQDINDAWNQCFSTRSGGLSGECLRYPTTKQYSFHPEFSFFAPEIIQRFPNVRLMSCYYYWRTVVNTEKYLVPFKNLDNFRFFAGADNTEVELTVYNISVQNYKTGDPSLSSPEVLDQISGIDFDGKVYPMEGADLTISDGYAQGETDSNIWARIATSMLAPLLHCKYPTLVDSLTSSCPVTCDTSC